MTSTILITGAGGPAGRTLGRLFAAGVAGGLDLRVVGVDLTPLVVEGFDEVIAVAPAANPAYAPTMRAAVEELAPDLIIPSVQDELPQIATLAGLLGRVARSGEEPAVVLTAAAVPSAIAADKLLTMWTLAKAGVPVPQHCAASDFHHTAEALAWAGGPVVVKPRVSRGGRGVVLVETPADLDWTGVDASQIVQGFAGGVEYAPQTYRSPRTRHARSYVLEKTVLKQGRVGNAAAAVRVPDGSRPEIERLAIATVEALGLDGPVDMDIRLDAEGQPLVLEVNGRFGALSALAPELLDGVLHDHLQL
ncbi:MAG: ATP-grasp domain-containing protein [Microlunatus sp.]|nr:ATP-grasp domain-containing protein [Microlunatus sp.]